MYRRGRKLLLNKTSSSRRGIQKQLVRPKAVKEIICTICNKQASIGVCLKNHKNNVLNKSSKLGKCITCGKKFRLRRYMKIQRVNNDQHSPMTNSVKFIKCIPCREKLVVKEKKIMSVKIRKLIQRTENLLTKCASSEIDGIVQFLKSVRAHLLTLKTNLHSLNV